MFNLRSVTRTISSAAINRANRAQYAEVSLQSFDEASMSRTSISLPSLQGSAEDEGQ